MVIVGSPYRGRPVVVLGLAKSGLAAARALLAGGTHVLAWDDDPARREMAQRAEVPVSEPAECDWGVIAALVPSPGVPLDHPMLTAARRASTEIVGDAELLWRAAQAPRYVGVTGTNGKSTTTALIGHILARAKRPVQVGGNLGTPALALETLWAEGTYVLEMSSFQLDLTARLSFDVAVLLNIAPDHLERHGSMDRYIAAKRKIFRSGRLATAIVGVDDADSRLILEAVDAQGITETVPVAIGRPLPDGVAVLDGTLFERGAAVCDLTDAAALTGAHNWQNAAAAFAAARACGLDREPIAEALQDFPGLPHRMERIACIDGVAFVNDSKATNAEATARALACHESIYWIAGGRPKAGGIAALEPHLTHVVHAFLIGEAEAEFAADLEGHLPCTRCGDLGSAVSEAARRAQADGRPGAVVLLSPACASFDQFVDFEARGEAFRERVRALAPPPADHAGDLPEQTERCAL